MGLKAGTLLWNRQRISLAAGVTQVNTGLTQVGRAFNNMSPSEPPLGVTTAPPGPADGTPPASRIQVIPMSPIPAWTTITHGEPYVNPATNTIFVAFNNSDEAAADINVLFWDPHSLIGPGEADTYNEED